METLATADGTKTAKPLIFLAAVGATFNRRLVDTASADRFAPVFRKYRVSVSTVCTGAQACLKFCTFSSQRAAFLPDHPNSQPTFRVGIENGPGGAPGRRFKQSSKGKRARRKKRRAGVVPPLGRFVSRVRDTSRYRRVVVDRSFDDPDRRKIQLVLERLCERGWTAPTRADTRANREPAPAIDVFSIPRQSDIIRV